MDNKCVLSNSFNEVIFEKRNKAYGAYQIRRRYGQQVITSVIIACGLFIGLFLFANNASAYDNVVATKPDDGGIIITVIPDPVIPPTEPLKPKTEAKPKTSLSDNRKVSEPSTAITSKIDITKDPVAENPSLNPGGLTGNKDGLSTITTTSTPCDDCPPELLTESDPQPAQIPVWVEEMPSNDALWPFLSSNIRYPIDARDRGIEGTVIIEFIVNKDGSFRDIKIIRGVCPSIDREAIRVAQKMPRWKPGKQNGIAVDVICRQPISFKLAK